MADYKVPENTFVPPGHQAVVWNQPDATGLTIRCECGWLGTRWVEHTYEVFLADVRYAVWSSWPKEPTPTAVPPDPMTRSSCGQCGATENHVDYGRRGDAYDTVLPHSWSDGTLTILPAESGKGVIAQLFGAVREMAKALRSAV